MLTGGNNTVRCLSINNKWPIEIMLQLCFEVGAHPYWVSPYLVLDPLTDFMPSLMTYMQANAPSWMIPRFEIYNECWNFVRPGSSYAYYKANANWGSGTNEDWCGKVGSVLGQARIIFGAAIPRMPACITF